MGAGIEKGSGETNQETITPVRSPTKGCLWLSLRWKFAAGEAVEFRLCFEGVTNKT